MAVDHAQNYQPSVESANTSATASPMPPRPGSPFRADYMQARHSRASSDASLDLGPKSPEQPIHDAVNSAFDRSNMSSQISPDLVSQITAAVIQNIKLSGVSVHSPPPTATSRPLEPRDTATASGAQVPPRNVYTPPSPEVDHAKPIPPDIRVNHLDGTQSEQPHSQRYGPKMSLKKEFRPENESASSQEDTSTLEKYWQPLFDGEGYPTARLGQLLRGVAMHLIEDYEPCNSLVILPHKMRRFYEEVKLPEELFPWTAVFNGTLNSSSLSHIYRDLYCQHHFVQRELDDKPSVPGLTPEGFQTWQTHVIRAYPEEELQRFAKVVQQYPISNADDRKERFPKQLPRCLFPKSSHKSSRHDLEDIVFSHPDLKLNRRSRALSDPHATGAAPPPPPPPTPGYGSLQPPNAMQQPTAPPPPPHFAKDHPRERTPYSASSSDAPVDDSNATARLERERERKPYSVPPSANKTFEPDVPLTGGGIRRSQSNATGPKPSVDEDGPRTRRSRADSTAAAYGAGVARRVARSPSSAARPTAAGRSEGELAAAGHVRDDSGEDLIKLSSRDSRGGRHPPPPSSNYEDDYQRRGPPPAGHGHGNYQYPPPPPRYG